MDNPVTNAAVSAVAETATNAVAAVAAATNTGTVFNGLDWFVIALFGLGMIATVWYSMRKKNESGKDYFLSGRDANWLQIGSSIFSSNIGSEHLVGLAGAGFHHRHGDGPLGNAWLDHPGAGLGLCAALRPHEDIHHARVSGTPFQPRLAQRPEPAHHGQPGVDQDRRHHLRRRRRHPHAAERGHR